MARSFLTPINLNKLELQNAAIQNLGTAPASPVKGQLYFNSTGGDDTLYWWNGTTWVAAKAGAGAIPATTVTTQAVGDAAVVGVATTFAREDHKHGRENFGSVTSQLSFGMSAGNGGAALLARSDHQHGTPVHDAAAHSTIPISALATATAAINMGGFTVQGVGTPVNGTDAANKNYVDNAVAGLSWKDSVRLASTANVTSPPTGLAAIDGVTPVAGDRILLKNQTTASENLIYVAAVGNWAVATDSDSQADLVGAAVYVAEGTVNADTAWVMTTNAPITLFTTSLTWSQFAGGGAVTAGAGMTQSGNVLNVIADSTITVGADIIGRAALTGDVTSAAGSNATAIAVNTVTNTKLADMSAATLKGNDLGVSGDPKDLTVTEVGALLGSVFTRRQYYGCAAATVTAITHTLPSQYLSVTVFRTATPFDEVECDVEHTNGTTVTVRFAVAPAAGEYTIVLIG